MKQFIGIRFSRYGQVRIGSYESENTDFFVFGQTVIVQADNVSFFGRVVWQCAELTSLFSSQKKEEQDNDGENIQSKNLIKVKSEFGENFEIAQIQSYHNVRSATVEELTLAEGNALLGEGAHRYCKKCIRDRDLDMKLVDVEMLFDKSKIVFYFTAPTRIDFRELVKDLVREYRTRIELRQIGVRHETQMLGTLGNCGMVVCCRRYLKEFAPVTIKMAKEQNLFLNPAKISGMCGRLLCCLSYEQENYELFHRAAPKLGKRYQTERGFLRVIRSNMFRNSVFVLNDAGQEEEINVDDWSSLNPKRADLLGASQNIVRNNSPFDNMGIEAEADLTGLLDEKNEYKGEKRVDTNVHKARTNPAYRPREKAQKRNNFDIETPRHEQNIRLQNQHSRNADSENDSRVK